MTQTLLMETDVILIAKLKSDMTVLESPLFVLQYAGMAFESALKFVTMGILNRVAVIVLAQELTKVGYALVETNMVLLIANSVEMVNENSMKLVMMVIQMTMKDAHLIVFQHFQLGFVKTELLFLQMNASLYVEME